jgi:hypothetical protein
MQFAFIRTTTGLRAGDETTQEILDGYKPGAVVRMSFDFQTDPRGEQHMLIDHREAAAYAARIRDAMAALNDDLVRELHQELRESEDFYIAVAAKLSPQQRTYLRALVNE